jgi:dolichol-phosphate mannosyltransferase
VSGNTKTLIVLPTYNEAANIARLVGDLRQVVPDADLLIVDDNSPDGTGGVADELAAAIPQLKVVHRAGKLGLGSAHILGLDHGVEAGYDVVVTMDCDYTHKPEDVPRLLAALHEEQADVAAGSRYGHPEGVRDWPLWRQAITRTAHFCTVHLLGIPHDATSAFRAYRTSALQLVPYRQIRGDGYSFIFEMIFNCIRVGLRIAQVPMEMPIRQAGQSKISRIEVLRAVVALSRLASARVSSQVRLLSSGKEQAVPQGSDHA